MTSFYYTLFSLLYNKNILFFFFHFNVKKNKFNRLKTAENTSIKNSNVEELQKQKADIERKIAREEVIENATKRSGTLSWNELRFTLALPKVR